MTVIGCHGCHALHDLKLKTAEIISYLPTGSVGAIQGNLKELFKT